MAIHGKSPQHEEDASEAAGHDDGDDGSIMEGREVDDSGNRGRNDSTVTQKSASSNEKVTAKLIRGS